MKHSKKVQKLKDRQNWYDKQPKDYQQANKRPGSVKLM